MANLCAVGEKDLALLNPALTDRVVVGRGYIPKGFVLKVPPEKLAKCKSGYRNVSAVAPDIEENDAPNAKAKRKH
jgi:hypothetical protein